MLIIISSVCVTVCAVLFGRLLLAKARLAEKSIDDAILRRMQRSPALVEMNQLRETNGVLRNLLIDFVENESHTPLGTMDLSDADARRLFIDRQSRRREIFGEALHALKHGNSHLEHVEGAVLDGSAGSAVKYRGGELR
jgi:hypothetical protein